MTTPSLRTITTSPDVLFWAAELIRMNATSAVYLLDGAPIYAWKTGGRWEFWRQ